ncbi:MAG: FMN-binding protein [Caldithrix sp.]|nr:FMN-binding protein [Caldithrix sp.]
MLFNTMRTKLFMLILCPLLLWGGPIQKSAETTIRNQFKQAITLQFDKYQLPPDIKKDIEKEVHQSFFMDQVYLWQIFRQDSLVGYALLDNVRGKSLPITFMVLFNGRAEITSSHIVKYRESIGGAVSNPQWQKQFTGKDASSGFSVGDHIDGISGATISVHAVSKGIRKLALLARYLITQPILSANENQP